MKNFSRPSKIRSWAIASCLGIAIFSCQPEEAINFDNSNPLEFVKYQNGDLIPGQYIVVMKPTGLNSRKDLSYQGVQEAMRRSGVSLLAKYRISEENLGQVYGSSIEGFAVKLTEEQAGIIASDPAVSYIEQDRIIALAPPPGKGPGKGGGGGTPPDQTTPWGITRVNGGGAYTGSGVAYIIDSGIDSGHEDLNVNASLGFNAFTKGKDSNLDNDGNGHGTHVAGTVAALDNEIGVIGVAPGATVVPVKVLDSRGSGSYSGVIAGVDFVGANGKAGDVANMSLGGGYSQAVNDAVIAASSKVKFSLAAGNDARLASTTSPASANGPNIYTISAMTQSDGLASFSNYGNPPVDYAAPGVGILSTVPGGYTSYSGTSMAAPHVAGILLLGNIRTDGTISGDKDSSPDPIAVH